MGLQLLSTAWGGHHIDLFRKTALKSLSYPRNLKALSDANAVWNIFTDDKDMGIVEQMTKDQAPGIIFKIKPVSDLLNYIDPVQSATIWQIHQCLDSNDKLLLVPPDSIFGEGSVHSLLCIGREPKSVVVVPHPRVLPSILKAPSPLSTDEAITNPWLVRLAWANLHDSWVHAEVGHPNQSSYVGGVEWQEIDEGTYAVTHRLPSPYLMDFTGEDLDYFESAISFGHFDHLWPGDILIRRERQRFVGSSDGVFIVEVTDKDKNLPPILKNQPRQGFWRNHYHNQMNHQITAIFRGE